MCVSTWQRAEFIFYIVKKCLQGKVLHNFHSSSSREKDSVFLCFVVCLGEAG